MLILISSNAEMRFQRNILDVLCYPGKHVIPFRYQTKYVRPDITAGVAEGTSRGVLRKTGQAALIVYAQRPSNPNPDFEYCPIRFGRVVALRVLGDIVFVDIELGEFPNLARWKAPKDAAAFRTSITTREGALDAKSKEGLFFDVVEDTGWGLWPNEEHEGEHWESVVGRLASLPSMRDCLFYRVRGFFQARTPTIFNGFTRWKIIPPTVREAGIVYPVVMAKPIELRMLFFRPADATPKSISAAINVRADTVGFSDVPVGSLQLESRYDELSVQLVTKRSFDSVLAPVAISAAPLISGETILASSPLLICHVKVPGTLLAPLLIALLLAPLLLAMATSDWACAARLVPWLGDALGIRGVTCDRVAELVTLGKGLGGLLAAAAGWIVFRRFPTGK